MNSNFNSIVPIIVVGIIIILLIAVCWAIMRQRQSTMIYTEEDETKPSEERTAAVQELLTLSQYWLGIILEGEPKAYSSDDFTTTFVEVPVECGVVRYRIVWGSRTINMSYTVHDRVSDQVMTIYGQARIKHGMLRENQVVKFLRKVVDLDMQLAGDYSELMTDFTITAQDLLATEAHKELAADDIVAELIVLVAAAIIKSKKVTPTMATLYVKLWAYAQREHPAAFDKLREHLPCPKAYAEKAAKDESSEEAS